MKALLLVPDVIDLPYKDRWELEQDLTSQTKMERGLILLLDSTPLTDFSKTELKEMGPSWRKWDPWRAKCCHGHLRVCPSCVIPLLKSDWCTVSSNYKEAPTTPLVYVSITMHLGVWWNTRGRIFLSHCKAVTGEGIFPFLQVLKDQKPSCIWTFKKNLFSNSLFSNPILLLLPRTHQTMYGSYWQRNLNSENCTDFSMTNANCPIYESFFETVFFLLLL